MNNAGTRANDVIARLRGRLRRPPALCELPRDFEATALGDHHLNPGSRPLKPGPLTPAAVLVPIVRYADEPRVLLTRRTAHLSQHSGQISFPGGRVEPQDSDVVCCALRETEEEIGLAPRHVEPLGALDLYVTITGFAVTPLVAAVEPGFRLAPDPNEVEEVFEVPLGFLLDPRNHQRQSGVFNGVERFWWAMPYGGYFIWGATAGMLRNLYQRLAD